MSYERTISPRLAFFMRKTNIQIDIPALSNLVTYHESPVTHRLQDNNTQTEKNIVTKMPFVGQGIIPVT